MKYKVISVEDAARLVEENGDTAPTLDSSLSRNTTLEKGLSVGAQTLQQSQKGKRDTLMFTLQIVQRNLHRSDQLEMINTQLNLLEAALGMYWGGGSGIWEGEIFVIMVCAILIDACVYSGVHLCTEYDYCLFFFLFHS